MVYWALGFLTSIASLSVYLEYTAYFPNRSGSEVVYLEQAFPRPRWLIPTAFAFQSVLLSFSSGNSIGEWACFWFQGEKLLTTASSGAISFPH
jgi:hypothetical protein